MDYEIMPNVRVLYERQEPDCFAMIPKMAQMDLDPYELALYCNYKQTAAESTNGASWKSNETLAKETRMSIRKISQCRQSLLDKGYITVTYETNENGKIHSTAVVTIIDVWQENHKRYAKGGSTRCEGGWNEMQGGVAPDANKKESVNKNQVEKDSFPKEKENQKDQELETMIALVKKELKQYKQSETLAKALLGRLKGKQAQYNLDSPITDKQLLDFVAWWDRCKKDRNGMSLTRPRNLGSVKSNIQEWLDSKPKQVITPVTLASESALQDRILDLMGE